MPRTNDGWLAAMRGVSEDASAALVELRSFLRAVVLRSGAQSSDVDDLVQESLARLVERLGSFRGDSAFKTWAASVAVRVVLTARRRRRFDRSPPSWFVDAVPADGPTIEDVAAPTVATSDRCDLFEILDAAIETHLSTRQRLAIRAELEGIPTVIIAEKLSTSTNALYKLVHDARKRLKSAILAAGFDESTVRAAIGERAP